MIREAREELLAELNHDRSASSRQADSAEPERNESPWWLLVLVGVVCFGLGMICGR